MDWSSSSNFKNMFQFSKCFSLWELSWSFASLISLSSLLLSTGLLPKSSSYFFLIYSSIDCWENLTIFDWLGMLRRNLDTRNCRGFYYYWRSFENLTYLFDFFWISMSYSCLLIRFSIFFCSLSVIQKSLENALSSSASPSYFKNPLFLHFLTAFLCLFRFTVSSIFS